VGAAGTQSRLTSASRSFLQACSHTHSQLPRGSALFLPHPETLTPSEYPGGKKASVFVLFTSSLACFCGREWGLVLEAVAAMKLRRSFLRRLTLPHGPAHGHWPGLGRFTYRRGGGPPVSGPCPAGSNDRIGRCGYLSLARRVS
jgi:hypothetical protein